MSGTNSVYDAIVIGAGIHGLASAYHLRRLGCSKIAVLERWKPGHAHGSSHGKARITRSTYDSADYVRLTQAARHEEWPRLEKDSGRKLVHPREGCFFGPPGALFETYATAVKDAGADVERVSAAEGRKRFPWFTFKNVADVLCDRTAGIVAAAETIAALLHVNGESGIELREDSRVLEIDHAGDPMVIKTDGEAFLTQRVVVTAGGWMGELFPFLKPRLKVARQSIGYFELEESREEMERFPPWVYLEDGENNIFYGLPEIGEGTLKIGRHLTTARDDDPNEVELPVDADALMELRGFLEKHLAVQLGSLVKAEHCLYTNTASEGFIIDLHPQDSRIAIGSACSGHGFKFGPLVGRILAELVLTGQCSVPEYRQMRDQLKFPWTDAQSSI